MPNDLSPEQNELTQRIRRRAFRSGDKATARQLLRLADEAATMRFTAPPRALLEQFRDEDPFMADLDLPKKRAVRPPRLETVYEHLAGNRHLTIERERTKDGRGDLTLRLSVAGEGEHFILLDDVDERRLRKAFAIHPQPTWQERQR